MNRQRKIITAAAVTLAVLFGTGAAGGGCGGGANPDGGGCNFGDVLGNRNGQVERCDGTPRG